MSLVARGLKKRFGERAVVDGVDLEVGSGEILALLGPSGSGKTTLLRLLAGFERADAGAIRWGDLDLTETPPERRDFGMVFQHYALFPHLSVGENVAFGLAARHRPRGEIRAAVAGALERVDLAGFENRRIDEISGGQQQRVALARALAPEPRLLLLDEPLSNLDPTLRERTRRELAATLGRIGISTVIVTHEQEEAFELGHRVALLADGRLAQVGSPEALYHAPATRFVAGFVGRASFLPATVLRLTETGSAEIELVDAPDRTLDADPAVALEVGEAVEWMVRPEALVEVAPEGALFAGRVVAERFTGALRYATVELASGREIEAVVGVGGRRGRPIALARASGARGRLFRSSAGAAP